MFLIRDHSRSISTPIVTYGLIALNVVVFLGSPVARRDSPIPDTSPAPPLAFSAFPR